MSTRPRRGRRLTDEERQLWRGVARAIKPLRKAERETVETTEEVGGAVPAAANAAPVKAGLAAVPIKPPRQPLKSALPLAPLGRRDRQKLARGREDIDARLDLHGMTQAQAHAALVHFLQRSQSDGAKFVLVVTGKGRRDRDLGESGVLRRQVPLWLKLPELRSLVVGFEAAHVGHGGEGALYVRIRRPR